VRAFINAGFGERLAESDLRFVEMLGADGVRQDFPASLADIDGLLMNAVLRVSSMGPPARRCIAIADPDCRDLVETTRRVIAAVERFGLRDRVIVEIGNEPNRRVSAADYADALRAIAVSRPAGVELITGGISNLGNAELRWLDAVLGPLDALLLSTLPLLGVGFHSYRDGLPYQPRPDFRTRGEEFEVLRIMARGRPLYHTEGGWSMVRRRRCPLFWMWKGLSAREVGARWQAELRILADNDVRTACVYQLNDGPRNVPDDCFGLRTNRGVAKESSAMLAAVLPL
jgi:hypothetical protein